MFAGRQRVGDDLAVIVSADRDRLDVRIGEQLAVIRIAGADAVLRADLGQGPRRNIAERRDTEGGSS